MVMASNSEHRGKIDPQEDARIDNPPEEDPNCKKPDPVPHGESHASRKTPQSSRRRSNPAKSTSRELKHRHATSSDVKRDYNRWSPGVGSNHKKLYVSPKRGASSDLDIDCSRLNADSEQLYNILRTKYDHITRENIL